MLSAGPTETEGVMAAFDTSEALDEWRTRSKALIPMGRVAAPDEIAKIALFLASEDSSFMTEAEVFADRGMSQV